MSDSRPTPVRVGLTASGRVVVASVVDPQRFQVELTARPHRPPSRRSNEWSWRCRRNQITLWAGTGSREHVIDVLTALLTNAPLPEGREPERVAAPTPQAPAPREVSTVSELLACWLDHLLKVRTKVNTFKAYKGSAGRLLSVAADDRLSGGPWLLRGVWTALETRYKPKTIQITVCALLQAWRWARSYGLTSLVPPDPLRIRPASEERPYTPTLDEVRRVIATMREPTRRILTLQMATGARISELAMLHREDVVEIDGILHVTFGRHDQAEKTGVRTVPVMLPEGVDALREALDIAGDREGPIWTRANGEPVTIHERSRTAARLRRVDWPGLGIRRFTSHGIRRMVATEMRRKGVPLEIAAQLLGHSIQMMLRIYRDIDDDDRIRAMTQLHATNVVSIR